MRYSRRTKGQVLVMYSIAHEVLLFRNRAATNTSPEELFSQMCYRPFAGELYSFTPPSILVIPSGAKNLPSPDAERSSRRGRSGKHRAARSKQGAGAQEKGQSPPYSLDSFPQSSFSTPEIKSPGSPTPAIFASNSTSTAAPFLPIFFKPRQS